MSVFFAKSARKRPYYPPKHPPNPQSTSPHRPLRSKDQTLPLSRITPFFHARAYISAARTPESSLLHNTLNMTAELIAAAAIGAAYLEAKTLISEDAYMIRGAMTNGLDFFYNAWKGKVQYWYAFEDAVKKYPNNPAIVYPKPIEGKKPASPDSYDDLFEVETYTYQMLYDEVLKMSHLLRNKYGVTANDTIALNAMNSPLFIIVWFAIWNLGATPAFINYNLADKSLLHCLKVGHASIMFVDTEVEDNVRPSLGEIKSEAKCDTVFMDAEFLAGYAASPAYRAPDYERHPEQKDYDTAVLIYTSGTTGLPKPAIMSWKKAKLMSSLYGHSIRLKNNGVVYSAMPLYHSTAAILGCLPCLNRGAAYAPGRKFSTTTFWTQAKLTNATHIQYVGETCRYLINAPPGPDEKSHQIKVAFGNGMRRDVWVNFKERFNIPAIGEFYAATEGPLGTNNFQQGEIGIGAMGRYGKLLAAILATRQTIVPVDPEDETELWRDAETGFCRVAQCDEPGEFIQKIPNPEKVHETFQGYLGNDKATNSKIMRDVFKKGDAYYRTGDLVRLNDEQCYYFVDRLGDTFRWKSENVSTSEVEEHVGASDPNIEQVVCVGVKVPEHEGRAGFAVIKLKDASVKPNLDTIASYSLKQLPKYAVPLFVKFVDEIERTGNNKVQKVKYKNQKMPHEAGESPIYWLKGGKYVELDAQDWASLGSGKIKL